jgi:hypothetical protein
MNSRYDRVVKYTNRRLVREACDDDAVMRVRREGQYVAETKIARDDCAALGNCEGEDLLVCSPAQAGIADVKSIDACTTQLAGQGPRQILVDKKARHLSNRADLLGLDDLGCVSQSREDVLALETVLLGYLVDGHSPGELADDGIDRDARSSDNGPTETNSLIDDNA